jgi:glycosyltransferase involved in cell wall biosynthesis
MAAVFIGIPTLNRPDLVLAAINSIRRQTFTDYRVIVSDDRSDGDTADRVEQHVAGLGDPRFAVHRQPSRSGEYQQGRFLFAASANEEFFVILHDDDVLEPEYLAAGVQALRDHPAASLFVANPYVMDEAGIRNLEHTSRYLRGYGRNKAREGLFDVLSTHLQCGFTPISGTFFRRRALVASGFADEGAQGNFPFESDVFLRLGDIGAKGWFGPRELLGLRYHQVSIRNTVISDPHVVRATLGLFARRRFAGPLERRRKAVVSRLHRVDALLRLRQGDIPGCRAGLRRALSENRLSCKAWALLPLVLLSPGFLRVIMPPISMANTFGGNLSPRWRRGFVPAARPAVAAGAQRPTAAETGAGAARGAGLR